MDYEIIKNPAENNLTSIFNHIFGSLVFTRVNSINSKVTGYTTYAAKVQSFVGNGSRYVLLVLRDEHATQKSGYLGQLKWVSFQTRTLSHEFTEYLAPPNSFLKEQSLDYKLMDPRYAEEQGSMKIKLNVKYRDMKKTDYFCPLPIELEILHDEKKKGVYQYPDTLDIRQALNTFQCVIKKIN